MGASCAVALRRVGIALDELGVCILCHDDSADCRRAVRLRRCRTVQELGRSH